MFYTTGSLQGEGVSEQLKEMFVTKAAKRIEKSEQRINELNLFYL